MRFWLVFITASSFLGCGTEEAASTAGTAGDLGGGDDVVADVGEPDAVEPSPDLGGVPPSGPCAPFDRPPYGRAPYQGIHGGPGHSDLAACDLAPSFTQGWHALAGYGVAQPNTFSPDGHTTYVTTSAPPAEVTGCTLHALDMESGAVKWCVPVPGAVSASADVDVEGHLYLAASGAIRSLTAQGKERWRVALAADEAAYGSHFTPDGHVAAVTSAGRILVLARADGAVVSELDLLAAFKLVVPESGAGVDLISLLPDAVREDFARVFGADGGLFKSFAGAGSAYTDNTVAIGPDGALYAVGVGVASEGAVRGAVVKVSPGDGGYQAAWRLDIVGGSASSPSLSPDGRWLKVTDGNSVAALLKPQTVVATAYLVDVPACDANTDADPLPEVCAPAETLPLRSGPALGASPVLEGAEHYQWEVQLATLTEPSTVPDLTRYDGAEERWSLDLPGDAVWSSVLTLTNEHIVGTTTRVTASETSLLGLVLPATAESALTVVRRDTGEVVLYAPVPDDSTSTVVVGPDGALYVTMLGLLSGFAVDTPIVGGVVKFAPSDAPPAPFDLVRPATPVPSTGEAPDFSDGPWVAQPFPGDAPPSHPYLAPTPDSNIHNDGWMTDAYDRPGPLGRATVGRSALLGGLCGTLAFDRQGRVLTTCMGISDPALVMLEARTLGEIARFTLPPRAPTRAGQNPLQDYTGGGYFALDHEDRAILVTSERALLRVGAGMHQGLTVLEEKERLDLSAVLGDEERVTSALPDWQGSLTVVTRAGRVLVRDGEAWGAMALGEGVQNSFAVAEDGVYLVTEKALYRLGCDGDCAAGPAVRWRFEYESIGVEKPGQADTGSGTTPTLFDHELGGLVAITDNADPMQVVVRRRDDGTPVCAVPVFTAGGSATENSLIASGRSLFVENNYGYESFSDLAGKTSEPGFARVDVAPDGSCQVVWTQASLSAPTVVPKLSRATGLLYTYTKDASSDGWYWTALNAHTGDVAFRRLAGVGTAFNNNYAGLALGPDGAALLGVVFGVVRLEDRP